MEQNQKRSEYLKHSQEKDIRTQAGSLTGKRMIIRVDTNTSLGEDGKVDPGEDWRIQRILPTLEFLRNEGAKVVVLAHQGRKPEESTYPIWEYLAERLPVSFQGSYEREKLEPVLSQMENGDLIFMENVRRFPGEKENDPSYLQTLIDWAELYVNEAFSASHRKHASLVALPKLIPERYLGIQHVREIEELMRFLSFPKQGKTLVLGGAKFGTKLPLIEKMLPEADHILLGGALANAVLKARGFAIGKSLVDDSVDVRKLAESDTILLPIDYVDEHGDIAPISQVGEEHMILDTGPETEELYRRIIRSGSATLWNGPMGKYEGGYVSGSIAIAEAMAESKGYRITGGGDTSTVILEQGLEDDFDFISTGGGAMLEFLVHESLPATNIILSS